MGSAQEDPDVTLGKDKRKIVFENCITTQIKKVKTIVLGALF